MPGCDNAAWSERARCAEHHWEWLADQLAPGYVSDPAVIFPAVGDNAADGGPLRISEFNGPQLLDAGVAGPTGPKGDKEQ